MTVTDIEQVVALELITFGHSLGKAMFEQEIKNNDAAYYYVLEDQEIIGYLSSWIYEPRAEIINFLIKKEYRGQGLGKKLFEYMINLFQSKGVLEVSLDVRSTNNAVYFYERFGFKTVYDRKNYYQNVDAYLMIKKIGD